MKKKLILLIALVTCLSLTFSSCALLSGITGSHVHDYRWVDNGDGTHVRHCFADGCPAPDKDSGKHVWDDDGNCVCGATKVDNTDGNHVHNYKWIDNGDGTHVQHCINVGCDAPYVNSGKHEITVEHVDANCVDYAKDVYDCKFCDYGYSVIDETSPPSSHDYQAYVCVSCQQDLMLEYVDMFDNHGTSKTDPVVVNSRLELALYIDYMYFCEIFGSYRYINLAYVDATSATKVGQELLAAELDKAINAKTGGSFNRYGSGYVSSSSTIIFSITDESDSMASLAPGVGYNDQTYSQLYSPAFGNYNSSRADDFDDFKYLQRWHQLSVSTSDQLFYAFEHGYQPVPVAGSSAERMLNKAKTVARNIMDDSMSDIEKTKAIYTWLVEYVDYDYGAAAYTNRDNWQALTAFYLEGVFDHGVAVCDGISKAYCVLAGLENITCVRVTGELADDGGGHAWNKVLIDGNGNGVREWYVSDATWANTLYGEAGELFSLQYFLMTDSDRAQDVSALHNYVDSDCDAVTPVNPFEYFYFGSGSGASYDFVVESRAELTAILRYVVSNVAVDTKTVCFNVYVTDSYCSTLSKFVSELQAAFSAAHLSGAYGYTFDDVTLGGTGHVAIIYFTV